MVDDLQKLVEMMTAPYKQEAAALRELVAAQKEEIQFLRKQIEKQGA